MLDPTYDREEIDRDPVTKLAFSLSEQFNDNAPIGWVQYMPIAKYTMEHARRVGQAYSSSLLDPRSQRNDVNGH